MNGRKRILVVDDEEPNRCLLQAILESLGYEPVLACDGQEALECMAPDIDLVLLDIMMPGIDGFELTRRIRERPDWTDIPVIMVTGLTSKEDRLQATEAGANDFISKPIDSLELRIRMKSLLKMKEAQDLVKRHRTELELIVGKRTQALRESEKRYRTLFEDSLDPILMVARDGSIIDANRAFLSLFGFSAEEIMHVNVRDVHANPEDFIRFQEELLTTGSVRDYEWKARTKEGLHKDCLLTSSARWDSTGTLVGYQSIIRDITDRKRAEAALRESEARTRVLIESSPIGIMMSVHRRYSYVNPAFVRMFGYETPEEIVGLPLEALWVPENRVRLCENVESTAVGTEPVKCFEVRGLRKSGDVLDVSLWLRSIRLGGQPALLGFVVDVSEERALREQLLQAQKMQALGTLAGGIAHDFNNILFAIMGFTELALEDAPPDTLLFSNLEQVMVAANRAKELVQQILTFSRQTEEEKHPLQLGPIVKETLKFLRASIPSTISIRSTISSELGIVLAQATQIHQVLMNLCANAAHAMRDTGGELSVDLEQIEVDALFASMHPEIAPGPHLRLTVSDTGNGIPREILRRIFDPYFTTKKFGEGTGLGLAVVHGIVQSHRGVIEVESEPGQGTVFRIYFPIWRGKPETENLDRDAVPSGSGRVLFVDDEQQLVELGKRMLESIGYTVVARTDSTEALELFRGAADEFDLVVTDMTMPNMTGVELIDRLRSIRADIPAILLTGYSEQISEQKARDMGIGALVMKPVLKREMAAKIRLLLEPSLKGEN